MGKRVLFPAVAFLSVFLLQGCCSTPTATKPPISSSQLTRSAKYFWDVVATPIYGKRIAEAPQGYKLQVALKEKNADGTAKTIIYLPTMKASYSTPATIEIERPEFSLNGCVTIQQQSDRDIIHYSFETRKKDLILKENKSIPVTRS